MTVDFELNGVSTPVIGKHTFETLTTGMYSNPLDSLREYVQNSVDAIEEAGRLGDGRIDFGIDPEACTMVIRDNGDGIPAAEATATLQDVGRSCKPERPGRSRGFRGIGRLGGLAYCKTLIFTTQYRGEAVVTRQEWDCRLLRKLLRPDHEQDLTMTELIAQVSSSEIKPAQPHDQGFFQVEMIGVTEPMLLKRPQVKHHLSQVAPVAFDASSFKFWSEVDNYLARQVPDYVRVDLLVDSEPVFKPYSDSPLLSRAPGRKKGGHYDTVRDIDFLTLTDSDDSPIAYAWVAKTDLKGLLDPESGVAGVRLRAGNIGIGDGRALVECFPKSDERFVPYIIGEVHVTDPKLIPNARRDGFEHGHTRDELVDACARQIAVPYRKRIREASANRSVQRGVQQAQSIRTEAEEAIARGLLAEQQREAYREQLAQGQQNIRDLGPGVQRTIEELQATAAAVAEAPRLVDVELGQYRKPDRDRFQGIFDILYDEAADKDWAGRTIKKMVAFLKQNHGERRPPQG